MYFLKPLVQKIFRGFAGKWMTPNQASLLGVLCFSLVAVFNIIGIHDETHRYLLYFVPILLIFRIAFNALDGLLAREQNKASALGEIINELLDIIGDIICFSFILFSEKINIIIITIFFTLIWMGEFVAVLAKSFPKGHRRQESFGGGKAERMLLLGIYILFLAFDIKYLDYLQSFIITLSIFVFLTCCKRVRVSLKEMDHTMYQSFTRYGK